MDPRLLFLYLAVSLAGGAVVGFLITLLLLSAPSAVTP